MSAVLAVLGAWALGLLAIFGIVIVGSVALAALVWLFWSEEGQATIGFLAFIAVTIAALCWLTIGAAHFGQWILAGLS